MFTAGTLAEPLQGVFDTDQATGYLPIRPAQAIGHCYSSSMSMTVAERTRLPLLARISHRPGHHSVFGEDVEHKADEAGWVG